MDDSNLIKEILNGAALGIIFLCVLYLIGRILTAACIDGVVKHFKNKSKQKQNDKEKKK